MRHIDFCGIISRQLSAACFRHPGGEYVSLAPLLCSNMAKWPRVWHSGAVRTMCYRSVRGNDREPSCAPLASSAQPLVVGSPTTNLSTTNFSTAVHAFSSASGGSNHGIKGQPLNSTKSGTVVFPRQTRANELSEDGQQQPGRAAAPLAAVQGASGPTRPPSDTCSTGVATAQPHEHEDHSLEGRYARALFEVARRAEATDRIWEELQGLQGCLVEASTGEPNKLHLFLATPAVPVRQKRELIVAMSQKFGFHEATLNLLCLLLENGRINRLSRVVDSFEQFYRASRGEIQCLVTTAKELNQRQRKLLEDGLTAKYPHKCLIFSYARAHSILGGIVVKLHEETFDYSVASRLETIRCKLQAPL